MDKILKPEEEKLMALMETKSFEMLNDDERQFVSALISKEEYRFQHELIAEAKFIEEDEPRALSIPMTVVWYKRSVPLYQTLAAIAAVLVLTFFFLPEKNHFASNAQDAPIVKASNDTIYVDRILHDTVYQTETKTIYADNRNENDNNSNPEAKNVEKIEMPYTPARLPDLTKTATKNRGVSMKDDELKTLSINLPSIDN